MSNLFDPAIKRERRLSVFDLTPTQLQSTQMPDAPTRKRFTFEYPRSKYFAKTRGFDHIEKNQESFTKYGFKKPTDVQRAQRQMDGVGRYRRRYKRKFRGRGLYDGGGEYTEANGIVNGVANTFQVPAFSEHSDGGIVISHKEYLQDVFGGANSAFSNKVYPINPGLASSFPWLSQIAQNYDEYELLQCIFTYRSTVTDAATTTGQVATLIMATNYNVGAPPFNAKTTMMEYDGAMSSKVTTNQVHGVECDHTKRSGTDAKYIRSAPVVQGELKDHDWGNFNIAVTNTPVANYNQAVGELWVSYTVKLLKPKLFTNLGLGIKKDTFYRIADLTYGVGSTYSNLFQGLILQGQNNNIGAKVISTGDPTELVRITFPASTNGNFRIQIRGTGTYIKGCPVVAAPTCFGSTQVMSDMFGSYIGATDIPINLNITPFPPADLANVATYNMFNWGIECHVSVQTATAGTDNTLIYLLDTSSIYSTLFGTLTNAYVEIEQMNFNNGSLSSSGVNMATITFINPVTGQVVVPT